MRYAPLRRRLLRAMALAPLACSSPPPQHPPPPHPSPQHPPPTEPHVAPTMTMGQVSSSPPCPIDHHRDAKCSGWDGPDSACLGPRKTQIMSSYGLTYDDGFTREYMAAHPTPKPSCCYTACKPIVVAAQGVPASDDGWPVVDPIRKCIAAPDSGTTQPSAGDPACPAALVVDGTPRPFAGADPSPFSPRIKQCCYVTGCHKRQDYRGRPLQGAAGPLLAEPQVRADWLTPIEDLAAGMPAALRERVVDGWTRHAAFEHGSIAAFAKLSADLVALGAPLGLVAAAQRAGLDELRHATLGYALASAYAGRTIGPGRLVFDRLPAPSIESLVRDTFDGGCCGETVAAAIAKDAVEHARGPSADALRVIARDEMRHAELGWRVLAWAVRSSDRARDVLVELLRAEAMPDSGGAMAAAGGTALHGLLDDDRETQIEALVMREVVHPCARALLDEVAS